MKWVAYALTALFVIFAYSMLSMAIGVLSWPAIVILSFIATLVHELGHALVAHRLGARIDQIVVLPLSWRRGTRRLELMGSIEDDEIGGYVAYQLINRDPRRSTIWIALAGPAANILLFAMALLVLTSSPDPVRPATAHVVTDSSAVVPYTSDLPSDPELKRALEERRSIYVGSRSEFILSAILSALAVLSLGMGLVNLVPFAGSDGQAIWHAIRPGYR